MKWKMWEIIHSVLLEFRNLLQFKLIKMQQRKLPTSCLPVNPLGTIRAMSITFEESDTCVNPMLRAICSIAFSCSLNLQKGMTNQQFRKDMCKMLSYVKLSVQKVTLTNIQAKTDRNVTNPDLILWRDIKQ